MSINNNESTAEHKRHLVMRFGLLVVIMATLATIILYFAGVFPQKSVTAQQFVDLQEGDNPHLGFRRAHAKGICIVGQFDSNGSLANYSTADVFDTGSTPFLGRFSIAGNNPTAPDLKAPVRSLAFALNPGEQNEWRIAMNTPPAMAVATPDAFYEQLQALSPDPVTKQRDPEKIKAFFADHPESKAFNDWKATYSPTNSLATERYHSINAFYLVDESGKKQAVRWTLVPLTTETALPSLNTDSADALQIQLSELIKQGPVRFDWVFTLADATDDETNPTIPWPSTRNQINAGTVTISGWEPQQDGQCGTKNFDPLVLPKGILATEDPILRARSAAYAESFRRRATETLLGEKVSFDTEQGATHDAN